MAIASFQAGEAISAGDAVYVSLDGLIFKASSFNLTQATVVGIALDAGGAGSLIRVDTDALYARYTGLVPGEYRYLSVLTSGQLVSYSGWFDELGTTTIDAYLTTVGRAVTTSGMEVEVSKPLYTTNPVSVLLLESATPFVADAILLEDGSRIDLEDASV